MNHINIMRSISFAALVLISANAFAADAKPSTLLYISPNDYTYSVRLLHPYYDYWFEQGPIVEPILLDGLKDKFTDLSLCKANETADKVIRVTPSLFYNPMLRYYYGKLIATVYSGSGTILGQYVGEGMHQGYMSVNHAIPMHLEKAYSVAMQDLMTKIEADKANIEKVDINTTDTKMSCGLIGLQPEPRIKFY